MRFRACLRIVAVGIAASLAAAFATAEERPKAEIVTQLGHSDWVTSVVFAPDGMTALSGGWDNTLRLWDLKNGREIRKFQGHSRQVWSLAIAPDGKTALSGGGDVVKGEFKLWDLTSGREIKTFEGHSALVTSVAYSPDGKTVLSGSWDKTLRLWDLASGREIKKFEGHSDNVISVAFLPDGNTVLSGSDDKTLKLWDLASGFEIKKFVGHSRSVTAMALLPDGKTALSGSRDKTLRLWDLASGLEIRKFVGHPHWVYSAAIAPDGKTALLGGIDNTPKLWDLDSGREIRKLEGHSWEVHSVAIAPDGKTALSGSWDNTLRLWDLASGREIKKFEGHSTKVWSVTFSPDGKTALSASCDEFRKETCVNGPLRLWDLKSGREIRKFGGHTGFVESAVFSPDGKTALSGSYDGTLKLWELASGREIRKFEGHRGKVYSIDYSPDGKTALSGGGDHTLRLWDLGSGREIRKFEGHSYAVFSVAISPNGKTALSGGEDNTLRLWDLESGREIRKFEGHRLSVHSVAISPDGKTALSGGDDRTLKLWDLANGREIKTFEGHSFWITSVAFSPDGKTALSGGKDNTLRLWDLASGHEIKKFEGHSDWVTSVVFAPDGRTALSGSRDGTVRLWDLLRGGPLVTLLASREGGQLAITPAGFYAASGKGVDKMLHMVRGFETYSILQFYEHLNRPDLVEAQLAGDPDSKYYNAAFELNLEKILNSGREPKLERLNNRESVGGGKLRLAVRLIDQGGGIGQKVIWRVNGTVQGKTTAPGLDGLVRPGNYVIMEQELQVDPTMPNEIEVVAYNGKGLLATEPLRMSFVPVQGAVQEARKLYVLTVGVNEYKRPDWRLRYAAGDAKTLGEALQKVGAGVFGKDQVVILPPLLNENATESNISTAFARLAKEAKPQDVFVLFLSGHGRSIAGKGWYFLPPTLEPGQRIEDYAIGQEKLQAWLSQVPAQKSVIILDACEAGASEAFKSVDRERETVLAQLEHATGRNTIAAAAQGKAAYEGYNDHGVLTYAILEALNREKTAKDDVVDLYTLGGYISRRVPEISLQAFNMYQQPKADLKDNFPIGRSQPLLKAAAIACVQPKPGEEANYITAGVIEARKGPDGDAPVAAELKRNALVTVKACNGPWALIARGGAEVGYVRYSVLEPLN